MFRDASCSSIEHACCDRCCARGTCALYHLRLEFTMSWHHAQSEAAGERVTVTAGVVSWTSRQCRAGATFP
jgi:hypothetical protein